MSALKKTICFVAFAIFLFTSLNLISSGEAAAYSSKSSKRTKKVKELKKLHRKNISKRVIHRLLKEPFFKDIELPKKIVVARLLLEGVGLGTSAKDYTNLVVNELLNNFGVFILNQELTTNLSLNYSLAGYNNNLETRKEGIMLGANYYLSGYLKSYNTITNKGKVKRTYEAGLAIRNIRDNEVQASAKYNTSEKKRRKRR